MTVRICIQTQLFLYWTYTDENYATTTGVYFDPLYLRGSAHESWLELFTHKIIIYSLLNCIIHLSGWY